MNASLICTNCRAQFDVTDYNIVRMGSCCFLCGRWNSLAEMLENYYGSHVGQVTRQELGWLNRVSERQNTDLRAAIQSVEILIEQAILLNKKVAA